MNLSFLGTWWGHLLVQAGVGAAQIVIQGVSGHDFGQYTAIVQAGAAIAAESLAKVKTS